MTMKQVCRMRQVHRMKQVPVMDYIGKYKNISCIQITRVLLKAINIMILGEIQLLECLISR